MEEMIKVVMLRPTIHGINDDIKNILALQVTMVKNNYKAFQEETDCDVFASVNLGHEFTSRGIFTQIDDNSKYKDLEPCIVIKHDEKMYDVVCGVVMFTSIDKYGNNISLLDEQIDWLVGYLNSNITYLYREGDDDKKPYAVVQVNM